MYVDQVSLCGASDDLSFYIQMETSPALLRGPSAVISEGPLLFHCPD